MYFTCALTMNMMEMREGKRKVTRGSGAGCPVVLFLLWLIWNELEHMLPLCDWAQATVSENELLEGKRFFYPSSEFEQEVGSC